MAAYVRTALDNSPALRASFEEWRASAQRIRQARRLPEPVITYGYFVRRVETRVGPQRHKFGISQSFPWPSRLSAGADAASLAARSAQQKYEAAALDLTRRVADAYWRLWLIDRVRAVQQDQKRILEQFSSVVRGRLEVGQATLADLGQIDLKVSRLVDALSGLDQQERAASALLVAAIGAPPGTATPVTKEDPPLILPAESDAALRSSAVDHPNVRALGLMADAQTQRARAAGAEAYPTFTLGVDYIETGPAVMPGVDESGKDAIVAMIGAKVPIWGGVYGANEEEAHAESASFQARQAAARDEAIAELEKALSEVRDAARRVKLHRDTLVPQAETVYASGLGAYQVGRSTLASVLMAERDLNDIQLTLDRARAQHAMAWARLEQVVGRPVRSRRAP
jgi:outer membrane protein, heavy metal efflux system